MTKNLKNVQLDKNLIIFGSKIYICLSLGLHKGCPVQATGEAVSPQKRTSRTSKHGILNFFVALFAFLGSDQDPNSESGSTDLIESRSETF
jgi:hypothetical protein